MTVARPEPGELVKTVVELVDAVNAGGGGGADLTNYHGNTISLTADTGNFDIVTAAIGDINLTSGNAIYLESVLDASVHAGPGHTAYLVGDDGNAGITASSDGIQGSTGSGQTVLFSADNGSAQINMIPDSIDLVATSVTVNGSPIGGLPSMESSEKGLQLTIDATNQKTKIVPSSTNITGGSWDLTIDGTPVTGLAFDEQGDPTQQIDQWNVLPSNDVDGGTWTVTVDGNTTGDIAWDANGDDVTSALDAATPAPIAAVAVGTDLNNGLTVTYSDLSPHESDFNTTSLTGSSFPYSQQVEIQQNASFGIYDAIIAVLPDLDVTVAPSTNLLDPSVGVSITFNDAAVHTVLADGANLTGDFSPYTLNPVNLDVAITPHAIWASPAPIDLVQMTSDFSQTSLPESAPLTFILDPSFSGGAFARTQGSALYWSSDTPTRINVLESGYYEFHGNLVMTKGSEDCTFTIGLNIDGTPTALTENASKPLLAAYAPDMTVSTSTAIFKLALGVGQHVEFYGLQVGNVSEDNTVQLVLVSALRVA